MPFAAECRPYVNGLLRVLEAPEAAPLPQAELVEMVKNCSLMVLAAVQDEHTGAQDGIPNVLIESLTVGTPGVRRFILPQFLSHSRAVLVNSARGRDLVLQQYRLSPDQVCWFPMASTQIAVA